MTLAAKLFSEQATSWGTLSSVYRGPRYYKWLIHSMCQLIFWHCDGNSHPLVEAHLSKVLLNTGTSGQRVQSHEKSNPPRISKVIPKIILHPITWQRESHHKCFK